MTDPNKTYTRDAVCRACGGRTSVRMLRGLKFSEMSCSCGAKGQVHLRPKTLTEQEWDRMRWTQTNEFDLIYHPERLKAKEVSQ